MENEDIKKTFRITKRMAYYISALAEFLNISENDVLKMIIFEHGRKTKDYGI